MTYCSVVNGTMVSGMNFMIVKLIACNVWKPTLRNLMMEFGCQNGIKYVALGQQCTEGYQKGPGTPQVIKWMCESCSRHGPEILGCQIHLKLDLKISLCDSMQYESSWPAGVQHHSFSLEFRMKTFIAFKLKYFQFQVITYALLCVVVILYHSNGNHLPVIIKGAVQLELKATLWIRYIIAFITSHSITCIRKLPKMLTTSYLSKRYWCP